MPVSRLIARTRRPAADAPAAASHAEAAVLQVAPASVVKTLSNDTNHLFQTKSTTGLRPTRWRKCK
jgi:hypothetical protein